MDSALSATAAEQPELSPKDGALLARALILPVIALLVALVLIYSGSSLSAPGSPLSVASPQHLGWRHLQKGLESLAILFGLTCFPGGFIGTALGYLFVQNAKLASASLSILRIGQWVPFVIWSALVWLLVIASGQRPGRYIFVWTIGIPAVLLGTCYNFLYLRHLLRLDWRRSVFETAALACNRALLIAVILALTVWLGNWVLYPGNQDVIRHYVAASILGLFLFIVNWVYRTGIGRGSVLLREILIDDLSRRNEASHWWTSLLFLSFILLWHLASSFGYFRVSPAAVFNTAVSLLLEFEMWRDIRVSLVEVFTGIAISAILSFFIVALLSDSKLKHRIVSLLSLTYVTPLVLLPAWQGWLLSFGTQANTLPWQSTCVACFSFYPIMQTVWALRKESRSCTVLVAAEQALPYGFAAVLYGEMMSATAGLGFAVVVAGATSHTEKAFAIFLITLILFNGLSSILRLGARRYHPRAGSE